MTSSLPRQPEDKGLFQRFFRGERKPPPANPAPGYPTTWPSLSERARTDTEFAQSIIRMAVGIFVVSFGYWYCEIGARPLDQATLVLTLTTIWFVCSFLFSATCIQWPGHFWYRRVIGMLMDYGSGVFWIAFAEDKGAPFVVILLWVTIGNGLRFGRRYLGIAMLFAMASAVFMMVNLPYWRTNPSLSLMLVLCILIVPLYPFVLLQRTARAEQMARSANAEKSRYLAQASHDLRQPIHAIGLLAAQLADTSESEQTRDTAERIGRAVLGTAEIVQRFLDVAVIESGTLVAQPEVVQLSSLFDDLQQQLAPQAAWSKSKLRFVQTLKSVLIDRSFLNAMLQNLIANAIKYAPGAKVLIGCRQIGGQVSVYVIDAGRGMAPAQLARIKEPFYRALDASQGSTPGTGLGLAIVQRLAELAGARFDVLSETDRGTAAILGGLQLVAKGARSDLAAKPTHLGQLGGTRILLIEDDAETLEATESLLRRWGCEVRAVTSPPDSEIFCDIVVSDYQFDDGTNFGEHKKLLGVIKHAKIPLIMISGSEVDEMRSALRALSPIILAKPVGPAELRSALMAAKITGL